MPSANSTRDTKSNDDGLQPEPDLPSELTDSAENQAKSVESPRPNRSALTLEEAIKQLREREQNW